MTTNNRLSTLEKTVNKHSLILENHKAILENLNKRMKLIEDKVISELIGIKESLQNNNPSKWQKVSIFMGGFMVCLIILMIASAIIYR
jgi:regulator of replication initiation timing